MHVDKLSFLDTVDVLAAKAGMEIPTTKNKNNYEQSTPLFTLLENIASFYENALKKTISAHQYLIQRGLSEDIIKRYKLGFSPDGWDNLSKHCGNSADTLSQLLRTGMLIKHPKKSYDRFRNRIMFPIRDGRGRIVGFGGRTTGDEQPKYLNSPETPLYHKSYQLYGLYEAKQNTKELNEIFVVEGYMDVIALAQHDIPNAIATSGTSLTSGHVQHLLRHTKNIIFSFDGDTAGKTAAWRAVKTVLPYMQDGIEVAFIFLPEGEDPDSMVRKKNKEGFLSLARISIADYFFDHILQDIKSDSIDSRAKLAKVAGELIKTIPEGVFQTLMLEQLATKVKMQPDTLRTLKMPKPQQQLQKKVRPTKPSLMRLAIALLIQNPKLAADIDWTVLSKFTLPGIPLLCELGLICKDKQDINTGALFEHFSAKQQKQLAQLAALEHQIPESGIEQTFHDTLRRIQQSAKQQLIDDLLNKNKRGELNQHEKQQLQELISSK